MSGAARYLVWVDTMMQRLQSEQLESIQRAGVAEKDDFAEELLIVLSNPGVNAAPVEMTKLAKEAGLRVFAICSLEHSEAAELKPGSPTARLYELADLTLDNLGESGDAAVEVRGTV